MLVEHEHHVGGHLLWGTEEDRARVADLTAAALAAVATPGVARLIDRMEPGFPLWDEIAAAVWLDPTIVTDRATLYVDYDTQFGPGYGDTLSWRAGYQPGLGERPAEVVRAIDPERLEALMVRAVGRRASVTRPDRAPVRSTPGN